MRISIDKPSLKGEDIETLRKQTNLYLMKLSEAVDLMLGNIDSDNLSATLTATLKGLSQTADVISSNAITTESRINALQKNSNIERGDGYLKLGPNTMLCFGTANTSPVTFPKGFGAPPTVIFSAKPYTAVLNNVNATEFTLTNNPTRIDYIAIGSI